MRGIFVFAAQVCTLWWFHSGHYLCCCICLVICLPLSQSPGITE